MATKTSVWAAVLAGGLAALAACNKSGGGGGGGDASGTAEPPSDGSKAGTLGISTTPIAQSYPDGLSVAALSTDVSAETDVKAQAASVGTVAITYDTAALHLTQNPPMPQGPLAQGPMPPSPMPGNQTPMPPAGDVGGCQPAKSSGKTCYDGTFTDMVAENPTLASCVSSREQIIQAQVAAYLKTNQGTLAQRKEETDVLNGKGECVGPSLTNALEALKAQKDRDEDYDGYGQCFMPDFGIVKGKGVGTDELCLPSVTRSYMAEMDALVKVTLALQRAMICQAIKDNQAEKDLDEGETREFTALFAKLQANLAGATVKTAKIKRTNVGGKKRYDTDLVVGSPFGKKGDITMRVQHSPGDEKNAAYTGLINISFIENTQQAPINALSLSYERTQEKLGGKLDADRLRYELRSGLFNPTVNPFGSDGLLDFNVGSDKTAGSSGPAKPYKHIVVDSYPAFDVAKLSVFVNFGESYEEPARGFVFDVQRVDGQLKGCAIAGSASNRSSNISYSVRRAIAEGATLYPIGFTQPFTCDPDTGTSPYERARVWKQCFVRDDSGKYVVDATKTADTVNLFDVIEAGAVPAELQALPRPKPGTPPPLIGKAPGPAQPTGPAAGPAGPMTGPAVGPAGPMMPPAGPTMGGMMTPWKQACTICMQANCTDQPASPTDKCANPTIQAGQCCGMSCQMGQWGNFKCPTM